MHPSEFNNIDVWTKSHDDLDSSWLLIDTLVAGSWLLGKSHDTLLDSVLLIRDSEYLSRWIIVLSSR